MKKYFYSRLTYFLKFQFNKTLKFSALATLILLACKTNYAQKSICKSSPSKILGELGQSLAQAPIHTSANTKSQIYYTLKPYEYIILNPCNSHWYSVPMQNGKNGYVKINQIAKLPYAVTSTQTKKTKSPIDANPNTKAGIVFDSLKYIGTPYQFGGNDLKHGIDCSGFVQKLYGKIGINLPRTAAEQALVGFPIHRLENLNAGDRLYFWDKTKSRINHTGLYLGNGFFVHSSKGNKGVATDCLTSPRWKALLAAARR